MNTREGFTPPTTPAIFAVESDVYHASAGLSSSGLKLFSRSAAHYWERYVNPQRPPAHDTPAMLLGRQIHTAVLEPSKYFSLYYPLPDSYDRRTKQGKLEYEFHEAVAQREGRQLISADSHAICQNIAQSVHDNPAADFLFSQPGLVEQSIYWTDPSTGVLCKARPDKWLEKEGVILDLKSCEDAGYAAFQRAVANYQYHISAAWYRRGVQAITGQKSTSFIFCAFEKAAPHCCAFYSADVEMLALADLWIDNVLHDFADCLERDDWPGYPEKIQPISLPKWVKASLEPASF